MAEIFWQDIKKILQKKLNKQHYSTWIEPIEFDGIEENTINISVSNKFIKDWIEKNYRDLILSEAKKINSAIENINLKTDKTIKKTKIKEPENEQKSEIKNNKINSNININPEYTFSKFISGSSNQFASAAAMAVANNPATIYNPLFIYGGVGLGKTHLINAIGNEIIKNNKNIKVSYYSSEKFTNELINSIRYGKMDEFRNKFRSIDVLLIDDVQFIAGKERTQEEFFHTFNSLYESHKQIVVTSDKFPKEIPGLEERLRSRFEWGLIADIQPPDIETKQAILEAKAEQNNIILPQEVALFLSSSVISNIRELEGYLVRIGAYSSLTSTPISIEMAKNILKDIIVESNKELTIEDIQKKVSNHFNIKISEIKSAKRVKNLVVPRQIAMYLCRQLTSCSYPEIGDHFGGKDHSTVIHAIKKIEKNIEDDSYLRSTIKTIKNTLLPS
ncbi:chromosomal replication initiator protein DnaA [uncultured Desulfuromonas sp.]|uniref:chromosomal replication initiator protein DnaA n=1 Tax=uncultured Desulfuromonas sp. TaxID=181013 RepID=UPI002AAB2A8C|nr:chromosomal replication initiator protein DnaA [uncultured Desulfuromonas sp.]